MMSYIALPKVTLPLAYFNFYDALRRVSHRYESTVLQSFSDGAETTLYTIYDGSTMNAMQPACMPRRQRILMMIRQRVDFCDTCMQMIAGSIQFENLNVFNK